MPNSLLGVEGKSFMVIGGGQGMGESTARFLAKAGANVAIVDVVAERAESVAQSVQHLGRRGVAVADQVEAGMPMAFCQCNVRAARADLMRICAEVREELEPEEMSLHAATALAAADPQAEPSPARRIAGAIYVSCAGRGGPHFGGPSAEMQIVRHALGDVPLVGFFAGGEIAHHQLYGYTGVLTVFTAD